MFAWHCCNGLFFYSNKGKGKGKNKKGVGGTLSFSVDDDDEVEGNSSNEEGGECIPYSYELC